MSGLLLMGALVVAFLLVVVGEARPRRDEQTLHARRVSFLARYEEGFWSSLTLAALALAELLDGSPSTAAAALGVFATLADASGHAGRSIRGVVYGLLGSVAAVHGAASFIAAVGELDGIGALRASLMSLLVACVAGGWFLSPRRGSRIGSTPLVMFGLLEIVTFLTGPGGAPLHELSLARFIVYLIAACGAALLLGWFSLPFVQSLTAAGVAAVSVLLVPGTAPIALVSALVPAAVVRLVVRFVRPPARS